MRLCMLYIYGLEAQQRVWMSTSLDLATDVAVFIPHLSKCTQVSGLGSLASS